MPVAAATAATERNYPSVSLLVPLAGATPWRARLVRLRRDAETRLCAEYGPGVDRVLLARLDAAVDTAQAPPGARSLAVYVNVGGTYVAGLDVDVRERTVIDDTFATRDLVAEDLRKPRYWVVALSLDSPRLLHGHGERLHTVALELRDTFEHPSSRGRRHGKDRSDLADAHRTRRLRALDQAIAEPLAATADPIIAVGAEPTLSRFLDTTHHIVRVETIVRRAPAADLAELAASIAPALAQLLGERRTSALAALDRAVGAGTAASGIEPVWREAHRHLPGLLLVEHTYEQPAHVLPGGGIAPAVDPTEAGILDDAVDDIIEAVLARGGRVELLPDRSLAAHQRIAFVPTHRGRR